MNFVFDLDGCLYPADETQIRKNIREFIKGPVDTSKNAYLDLVGRNVEFNKDDYWNYIRWNNITVEPRPEVTEFLKTFGKNCWLFTNCREKEARETLISLGIEPSFFREIFGIEFTSPYCKPDRAAFEKVKKAIDGPCTFFDDSDANVQMARSVGFKAFKLCNINDS